MGSSSGHPCAYYRIWLEKKEKKQLKKSQDSLNAMKLVEGPIHEKNVVLHVPSENFPKRRISGEDTYPEYYEKQNIWNFPNIRSRSTYKQKLITIKQSVVSLVVWLLILSPLLYFFVVPLINGLACYVIKDIPYVCPITFTLSIDKSKMTDYDFTALQSSLKQWESASNNTLKFKLVDYPFPLNYLANGHLTWNPNIMGGYEEDISGFVWIFTYRFRTIVIGSSYESCQLETITLHEIGHALGLGHSTNPNSVMYPYAIDCGQAITQQDVEDVINHIKFGFIF